VSRIQPPGGLRRILSPRQFFNRLSSGIKDVWRGPHVVTLGLVLLLISSLIVIAYYVNHPTPETYPDTHTYLAVTQQIMTSGKLVDPVRLPGYPLLIALTYWLAGQGNLLAVSIVQGILFVLAALEVYTITYLITRRAWMGLIVGLVIGSNIYLLSDVKPILSEGFSLWMVTSLALAVVLFIRSQSLSLFWLVAVFMLIAFMTRPEWEYAPVLIFGFLLLVAARHGRFRRLAPHVLAATLALYGLLGLFIYENAALNGFAGVTVIQRANLLGKVLQYDMQDEAPPQYAALAREADAYRAAGGSDPYIFAALHPELTANHWALANAYATAIVEGHPLEFALKTVPVILTSSNETDLRSQILAQGLFASPLFFLQRVSLSVLPLYPFFPLFALLWLGLFCWRRTARQQAVEMMAAVAFIGLYELVLISIGGYSDYSRLHIAFDPIMLLIICASLLLALPFAAQLMQRRPSLTARLAQFWPRVGWLWGGLLVGCIVLSALLTLLSEGFAALLHLHNWRGFSLVLDHSLLSGLALGVMALSTYCIYQAHCFQASASSGGKVESDLAPGRDMVQADAQMNSLPGQDDVPVAGD
jgi:hypothetical protein